MELSEKVRNIILVVEGGLGRELASSAVIRSIKKQYPDKNILVISGFNELFLYNKNVKKTFNFNNPLYFYEDYVNEESIFFKSEPYLNYGYLSKKKHLIDSWCECLNVTLDGKYPDFFYLPNEDKSAEIYVNKITEDGKKPLVLLQWVGGKVPQDKTSKELMASLSSMYRRSLPFDVVQELVNMLNDKGYTVGVVGHENYPELKNTNKIFFPIRSTIMLLKHSKAFIGIDSFLQHAAASNQIQKKGIVCWGGTTPDCLGYDLHVNLTKIRCPSPFCHRPNSYAFDVQAHGAIWDCPYSEECMKSYTAKEIIEEFEKNFEAK